MVARPVVFLVVAYLLGIIFYQHETMVFFVFLFLLFFLFSFLKVFVKYRFNFNRYDLILVAIPMFFHMGVSQMNIQMKSCEAESVFDTKTTITVSGIIKKIQGLEGSYTIEIDQVCITDPSISCCGKIMIYTKTVDSLKIGNEVTVKGRANSFSHATNPGQFDEYTYYKSNGICFKISADEIIITNERVSYFLQYLYDIKEKAFSLYQKMLPEKEAGVIVAMLLGERSLTDGHIKTLYQENGISHILAISGLHLSFIGMGIYEIIRKLRGSITISVCISIGIVLSYGVMTGFSVSAKRAIIMLCISLIAKIIGCTYDMLNSVSIVAFVVLYKQPMMVTQTGFLLSFGAILGIALVFPMFDHLLTKEKLKKAYPLVQSFMISMSIQLMTIPVLLYFYFTIPTYGVLINLIVLPLMSFVVGGALFSGILGGLVIVAGKFMIGGVYFILRFYEIVCNLFLMLPKHTLVLGRPSKTNLFIYYGILFIILFCYYKMKKKFVLVFLVFLIFPLIQPKQKGLETVFLDVGQGDGIFIRNEYGTSFLIDGGSSSINQVGTYRIRPFLLSKGIDKVDYVFITHADSDHYNGILELIKNNMVRQLVLTNITEKTSGYLEIEDLALKYGIPILYFSEGDSIKEGDFLISCYYPEKGMDGQDTNASSMVLGIQYQKFSMLMTGDIGESEEIIIAEQLKSMQINQVTLLKVAHHGSKYSSSEVFLKQTMPMYSVVSSGKNNSYGHPNKEALSRLHAVNSILYITAEHGAIILETDGYKMSINTFLYK